MIMNIKEQIVGIYEYMLKFRKESRLNKLVEAVRYLMRNKHQAVLAEALVSLDEFLAIFSHLVLAGEIEGGYHFIYQVTPDDYYHEIDSSEKKKVRLVNQAKIINFVLRSCGFKTSLEPLAEKGNYFLTVYF